MPQFVDVVMTMTGPLWMNWEDESVLIQVQDFGQTFPVQFAALKWAKEGKELGGCLEMVEGDLFTVIEAFRRMVADHQKRLAAEQPG